MEKVLLHACCAVCISHPKNVLAQMGFEVVPYFYNPNIYPKIEHDRRLCELKKIAPDLIFEKYSPDDFKNAVQDYENCAERGERCKKCFELRLSKTAKEACAHNISKFTTTLSVSPHKISADIFEIGEKIALEYGLEFLKIDFKKQDGFLKTTKIANELGLYKQSYCGCEYSIR